MNEVFEAGPWHFAHRPLFLQCWEPGMILSKDAHTSVPLWVKFYDVPLECWSSLDEKGVTGCA